MAIPVTFPRAVIFDWDSTLVDNWQAIHVAMNKTRAAFDLPEWELASTLENAKLSSRDSFPRVFGAQADAAKTLFYDHLSRIHRDYLVPLPGAVEILKFLHGRAVPMAIASNKQGSVLRAEIHTLGWQGFFTSIIGAGDAPRDKPAPDSILLALSHLDHSPHLHIWMIGDSDPDMHAALAAGIQPVLVKTGLLPCLAALETRLEYDNLTALHLLLDGQVA